MTRRRHRAASLLVSVVVMGLVAGCGVQVPSPGAGGIHADPELEAQLPTYVHGGPFHIESYREPDQLLLQGVGDDMLERLGVAIGDVSVAYGEHEMGSDASLHMSVRAFRARGVQPQDMVAYFKPIMEEQSEGIPLRRVRARGKVVWRPEGNPVAVAGNMLYVKDDTAYLIYGNNRTASLALLSQIPPNSQPSASPAAS